MTKPDVVVLCWGSPTRADRNAQKIAAFMGANVTCVALDPATVRDDALDRTLVPRSTSLIVQAETIAAIGDAKQAGASAVRDWACDVAQHVCVFGFQPTDRHAAILRAWSSGALVGFQPLVQKDAPFHVTNSDGDACGPLSGLSLGTTDSTRDGCFVERAGEGRSASIIRADDSPFFVRADHRGAQLFFLASGELADLDEQLGGETRLLSWFSRVVPLMIFLRAALQDRVWHSDNPRACLIIDDPLLSSRYGFLDYTQLAASMRRQAFSACIAFIPWNYRRSKREVAALFSSTDQVLRLCVHGCDHTRGEFATTDVESLRAKAQLALERMQAHRELSDVPFDDVMVFPQGLFSTEAMSALKASGFLAAVNSALYPSGRSHTLALRELLDVAVTSFGDFPLFSRRYPRDLSEFALDLFLGKPVLAVEHHKYFRNGYAPIESFVEQLNGLDRRLEWTDLGTICSRASLTRTGDTGEVHVRFYTDRFRLTNTGASPQAYVLHQRQTSDRPLPAVSVNGHTPAREVVEGDLLVRLSLDAGQTAEVRVLSDRGGAVRSPRKETRIHDAGVRIRRHLSEFRDNHVDTSPTLSAIVALCR